MPTHTRTARPDAAVDLSTIPAVDSLRSPAEQVTPGGLIGRYIVIRMLGAGGMGVVLAAYDPKLDRKVALKLLNARSGNLEQARARLQREAQALARLDHPNVVGVYDVEQHGEQLFVSMELIAGQTLREWLRADAHPRPWREVLARFVDAGRGLATAHEAGLVHRDFKPENVMLGDDGRVRVMDFGLATLTPTASGGPYCADAPAESLTQTGAAVGTPAYMPPEQLEGRRTDARGDQFSFCVSLYEALYGRRPFSARSIGELLRAFARGQIDEPPSPTKVPPWLRRAVVRGLATDPNERWPSMTALLDALTDDPSPRRRRRGMAALGLTLAAGGAWALDSTYQTELRRCAHAAKKLEPAWNVTRRADLEQAFSNTGLSYAADTWARVEDHVESYASDWIDARVQACEATHHGEQSGELLDLRMACLDERRLHLRVTLDELARVDTNTLQNATKAVLALPDLARCADLEALTAAIPPPDDPDIAAQVAALDQQLIEARARQELGEYDQAAQIVDSVVAAGEPIGFEPLMARAWLQQGTLQEKQAEYRPAEATLTRALHSAIAQGMQREAAVASVRLAFTVGYHQARHEDGRRWAELADSFTRAANTTKERADWLVVMGVLAKSEGDFDNARRYYERALSARERAGGPDHPDVARTLSTLGHLSAAAGRNEEALTYQSRALDTYRKTLGPEHPRLAFIFNALGDIAKSMGDYDQARAHAERALAINESALGPEHPLVAVSLNLLGIIAVFEGELEVARAHFERTLTIRKRTLGPDHPEVAGVLANLGNAARVQGRNDDALGYYQQALTIWENNQGHNAPDIASTLYSLGMVSTEQGNYEVGLEHMKHALQMLEDSVGPHHPRTIDALAGLGQAAYTSGDLPTARQYLQRVLEVGKSTLDLENPINFSISITVGQTLLGLDQLVQALPLLEHAVALEAKNNYPSSRALARFALAQALWEVPSDAGRDRARALVLAQSAQEALEGLPDVDDLHAEVTAWLSSHPTP